MIHVFSLRGPGHCSLPLRARMVTYHPSNVAHGGMESLSQHGNIGHAQMGDTGMEMHGSHAQHPTEMGMGGVKHLPPSVS